MLCIPSMEARSNNWMLMRNHFLRDAVEMVLGRQIVTPRENAAVACAPHGSRRPTPIVGSGCVCRDQKSKQRNILEKAVCFASSLYATNIQYLKRCASFVKMNKLFLLYSFLHVVNKLIDLH